jgi:hypothetical protein
MTGLRALATALLTGALALLAGCGSTETLHRDRTLYVALTEYRVAPQSASVRAGDLTVFVQNYGRLTHNLMISRGGALVQVTRPLSPGQSAEIALTLTPGSYLIASTILSDQALGAYGTLRVTS